MHAHTGSSFCLSGNAKYAHTLLHLFLLLRSGLDCTATSQQSPDRRLKTINTKTTQKQTEWTRRAECVINSLKTEATPVTEDDFLCVCETLLCFEYQSSQIYSNNNIQMNF